MDRKLLNRILHIQSESFLCEDMQNFIADYAIEQGWNWDADKAGNIYVSKGVGPYPCAVAHMDTVHDIQKAGITLVTVGTRIIGMDSEKMDFTGVGGDDKCGIYAAFHCMNALENCKAAFFVDEEVGCVGSYDCDLTFFADCRFILQADRRGNDDFVTDICGPLSSKRFLRDVGPILRKFGYKECDGMMSDVMALRDNHVGISVANMSAGYYRPHFPDEYIDLEDLEQVCRLMETICREMTSTYPFKWTPPKKAKNWFTEGGAGKLAQFPDWDKESKIEEPLRFYASRNEDAEGWDKELQEELAEIDRMDAEYARVIGAD